MTEGRQTIGRHERSSPVSGRWKWLLTVVVVLVAIIMLGPQLIEHTDSSCGAAAIRVATLQAGNNPLDRVLAPWLARQLGGSAMQAQIEAQNPQSLLPADVRCALGYWTLLFQPSLAAVHVSAVRAAFAPPHPDRVVVSREWHPLTWQEWSRLTPQQQWDTWQLFTPQQQALQRQANLSGIGSSR